MAHGQHMLNGTYFKAPGNLEIRLSDPNKYLLEVIAVCSLGQFWIFFIGFIVSTVYTVDA